VRPRRSLPDKIFDDPNLELGSDIKRLRQAHFKQQYAARHRTAMRKQAVVACATASAGPAAAAGSSRKRAGSSAPDAAAEGSPGATDSMDTSSQGGALEAAGLPVSVDSRAPAAGGSPGAVKPPWSPGLSPAPAEQPPRPAAAHAPAAQPRSNLGRLGSGEGGSTAAASPVPGSRREAPLQALRPSLLSAAEVPRMPFIEAHDGGAAQAAPWQLPSAAPAEWKPQPV
jgi:hypothetical protein